MYNKRKILFFLWVLSGLIMCAHDPATPDEEVIKENIYINEVNPLGSPDWVELYNAFPIEFDLAGYHIYDTSTITNKYTLPTNTILPAGGFLILLCNDGGIGINTNFKLTSAGEIVYLENDSGVLLDSVTYPLLQTGESYARIPNGSRDLTISKSPTYGSSNNP